MDWGTLLCLVRPDFPDGVHWIGVLFPKTRKFLRHRSTVAWSVDDIGDPGFTSVVLEQYAYAGTIGGHPLTASGHGISGDLGKNAAVTTVRQLIVDMSGRWFRVDLILATN